MQTTGAYGPSTQSSNVWQLQQRHRNDCFHKDRPNKNGDVADIARSLPEDLKERLRTLNIRSIDPVELSHLAATLHREDYLSHEASAQLGFFQLDFKGLFDPLAETRAALQSLCGKNERKYALCIDFYKAAIDAMEGLEALVDHLNGRTIDTYA
jgi:hypothetical protein